MAGCSSGMELKGGIPREVPIAMGAPVVTEHIQPVIGQPVDNTPMGLPVAPPPRQPQQPPRLTIGGDEPPSVAGWGSRQEELPRDAQFEREQWQRRGVAAMLVFGLAVQLVDVLSDISLYVAIGNAKEAEREGATAARDNLTALGAASPFYSASPEVLALNASYGALAPEVQAETCDPLAAALRLAEDDRWEDPASRLASLEQASLVFIFASILPLLCTMTLTWRHLRRTVTAHSRAAAGRRTGQQAPGRGRKAAEVERRGAIVMGQMLVQLAEDVPQVRTRRGPLRLSISPSRSLNVSRRWASASRARAASPLPPFLPIPPSHRPCTYSQLTHGRRSRPHLAHPHTVLSSHTTTPPRDRRASSRGCSSRPCSLATASCATRASAARRWATSPPTATEAEVEGAAPS